MIDLVEIFGTQLYYGCRARVGVNMDLFVGHKNDVGQTGAGGNFAPFTDVGSIMRLSRSMKNNQGSITHACHSHRIHIFTITIAVLLYKGFIN